MYVNKCTKCGREFETKNPKRVICPDCLYPDKKMIISTSSNPDQTPEEKKPFSAPAGEEPPKFYNSYSAGEGREQRPMRDNQQGGYNRGGYNRPQQGGYNRPQQGGYNRDNQQGGYNRGGYNRPQQGGYNRDNQQGGYNRPQQGGYNRDNQQGGYNRPQQGGYNRDNQQGGYNRPQQGGYNRDNQQGGYNRPQQGGYNRDNQQGGYNRPQQGGYNRDNQQGGYNRGGYNNRPQQGGYNRRPMMNNRSRGPKQLLISREQLEQIELLYKVMLPLPNPDAHEVIGEKISLEPRKVFFGINLVRQKMMLPKLPFPKRKLAISPDQMFAIKNLYEPLLPLPPMGCHKIIASQLKMDEWRVHVGIGLVRSQMGLERWNQEREDAPKEFKKAKETENGKETKAAKKVKEVKEVKEVKATKKVKETKKVEEEAVVEEKPKRARKPKKEESAE